MIKGETKHRHKGERICKHCNLESDNGTYVCGCCRYYINKEKSAKLKYGKKNIFKLK